MMNRETEAFHIHSCPRPLDTTGAARRQSPAPLPPPAGRLTRHEGLLPRPLCRALAWALLALAVPAAQAQVQAEAQLQAQAPLDDAADRLQDSAPAAAPQADAGSAQSTPDTETPGTEAGGTRTLSTVSVSSSPWQDQPPGLRLETRAGTGSHLGLSVRETPASVTVVEREAIEARGARNTHEALQTVPGVHGSATPGYVDVSYRGFRDSSLNLLFNGLNVQYAIAMRPVDTWIYERVEAVGGPSSFLYGTGGVGGTINFITRQPQRHDITEGRMGVGTDGLRQFSAGLNRRLAGDGSGAGDHYLRIDLNHRHGGDWSDGTRTRATQLASSLLSDLGQGITHTLAHEYQHENVKRPYWGTPLLQPAEGELRIDERTRRKNYNSADGLYRQRVQWLRSLTRWQVNERLTLRNTLYAYDALRDFHNVEIYRFNDTNTAVERSEPLRQRHDHQMVGNRLDVTLKSEIAGLRSDWAAGLDISHIRQTRFPTYEDIIVSTVDPLNFSTENFFDIPGFPAALVPGARHRVQSAAFYLENRTQLLPTLNVLASLRHERLKLDHHDLAPEDPSDPTRLERRYHPTTGRLGLGWTPRPGMMLYAQYATAADPASGILATASFSALRDNSRLASGRQMEVGGKFSFLDDHGQATVALYDIRRRNIATTDPQNRRRTLPVGQQNARGIELGLALQPDRRWTIEAHLNHTDAEYRNFVRNGISLAGKQPTNIPSSVATLSVQHAFSHALRASLSLQRTGRLYADSANTRWWPAHTVVNLGMDYRINPKLTLSGHVHNVGNTVYAEYVDDNMAVLGSPRMAEVWLKLAF